MLELNDTYLKAGWKLDKVHYPRSTLTAIVKGTYDMRNGSRVVPSDIQTEIGGDQYFEDDPAGSMTYSSDFVPFKPHADILLVGHAWVPGGLNAKSLRVSFSVGNSTKHLVVTGNRHWISDFLPSNPEPFSRMALSYQNAFGGNGFDRNPIGKGYSEVELPNGARFRPFPNIEQPGNEIHSHRDLPEPAGFSPLPLMWPQRRAKSGTYDEAWRRYRWPWLPVDFDFGFFNSAPPDQIVPYLRGDERLRFENLHPDFPLYECALPGIRVRCFYADVIGAPIDFSEIAMALDTVWIDMDTEKLVLVWRGVADLRTEKIGARDWLALGIENLTDPLKTLEHYEFYARTAAKTLEKAERPPVLGKRDFPGTPSGPSGLQPEVEPPTAESCLASYARGQSFQGKDLTGVDLSGSNLENADFRAAILAGALFRHTRLAGANFSEAMLSGADLSGADLRKAVLSGADLTEARLTGAQCREAQMARTDFSRAVLREANFEAVQARQAIFRQADLFRVNFRKAQLTKADFGRAELHEADFSDAVLAGASMEEAVAFPVHAERADITGLRATEAVLWSSDFRNTRGEGSIWQGANLRNVTFSGANLAGATFDKANLLEADLSYAILRHARLVGANLRNALVTYADFFDASVEEADLTNATFRNASLFGAKSLECIPNGTDFEGADLGHTLFEVKP